MYTIAFWVLGFGNLANGLWMLFWPEVWYHDLPVGIPDSGPLNLHFVRDLGAAYLPTIILLVLSARRWWAKEPTAAATA